MGNFSKDCPMCKKNFADLVEFMDHIKKVHKNIPSNKIFGMGRRKHGHSKTITSFTKNQIGLFAKLK